MVMGFGQGLTMPSLIRVVLSEVPIESAGAGSGVFTTMQQLSLAVGVASLGTLFISLSAASHLGAAARHGRWCSPSRPLIAAGVVAGSRLAAQGRLSRALVRGHRKGAPAMRRTPSVR